MLAIPLLVLFSFLPDNTVLPATFQMGGFGFSAIGAAPDLFVNVTGPEHGLQFPNGGLEVILPAVVDSVDLRACSFAAPVSIEALNAAGSTLATRVIPSNLCADLRLVSPGTASLRLKGGTNEGLLVRVAVAVGGCS